MRSSLQRRPGLRWNNPALLQNLIAITLIAVLLLLLFGITTAVRMNGVTRAHVADNLQTTLEVAERGYQIWSFELLSSIGSWARQSPVVESTEALLRLDRSVDVLRASPEQPALRDYFHHLVSSDKVLGYLTIAPDRVIIGSSRDADLGARIEHITPPGILEQAFAGRVVHTLPSRRDSVTSGLSGVGRDGPTSMLTLAPIRNPDGDVIAVLAFRLDPRDTFESVFRAARHGESGETYAFDRDGKLISESRFVWDETDEALPGSSGEPHFEIELRVPAADGARGALTLMADEATAGRDGESLIPYPDYRGVPVVGVWRWHEDQQFGIASEIDASEAFALYRSFTAAITFLTAFGILTVVALALLLRRIRLRLDEETAEKRRAALEYQQLFETAQVGVWTHDVTMWNAQLEKMRRIGVEDPVQYFRRYPEGLELLFRINQVNGAALKIFGCASARELEERLVGIYSAPDFGPLDDLIMAYWTGAERAEYEIRFGAGDSDQRHVLIVRQISVDPSSMRNVPVVIVDLTEREAVKAQLLQASKLATLGEMTTGMAHELKQPLHIIRLAVGNLRRMVELDRADVDYSVAKLDRIDYQVARAGAIIEQMQVIGRDAEHAWGPVDLCNAIDSVADMIREQCRLLGIELQVEHDETCGAVMGNLVKLEQVLLNLVANAIHVLEGGDGGRIRITSHHDGSSNRIVIEDNGGGVPDDLIDRIFEPFFTTKEVGKGTGLGLSVSYGIIKEMRGTLGVTNSSDGARFEIILPQADAADAADAGEPVDGGIADGVADRPAGV